MRREPVGRASVATNAAGLVVVATTFLTLTTKLQMNFIDGLLTPMTAFSSVIVICFARSTAVATCC